MPRFFASWLLSHSLAVVALCAALGIAVHIQAESPRAIAVDVVPQPLFDALAAGDLEASVFPRDAKRLTIQFTNKTDRPLTIQMPAAMAAAPILAQQPFGFPGGQQNNQLGQGNRSPQQLGLPGNGNNQGGNNQGGNIFGQNRGLFSIPAGRAIKIKSDCVCLEYGKPEPDARMQYELKPLSEVCDKPELAVMLRSLGDQQIDQRVAQAAAWHLTNELSWQDLARLVSRRIGGYKENQFTESQVSAAKQTLEQIVARQQKGTPSSQGFQLRR